jgi:hypothetical protein
MHFHCTETLKYPLDSVWTILRDHLPHIAEQQDDIEYVHVRKRDRKTTKSTHVISTWRADPPLPAFLKSFIKPDMLIWTDDATWDDDETTCHFTIITHYQVEDIRCVGTIALEAAGTKSTRITYSGTLTIKKTPQSSIFMTSFIIKGIEAVASKIIEHNFAKVVKTLTKTVKAKK